jgi:hypothetical protein
MAQRADRVVPVLEPDDPLASDKLDDILRLNSVSRRIDMADTGSGESAALGCPYVAGVDYAPADYLENLRTKPLEQLPDPTDAQTEWPLLYRLARLSLVRNSVVRLQPPTSRGRMTLHAFEGMPAEQRSRLLRETLPGMSAAALARIARVPANVSVATFQRVRRVVAEFDDALSRLRDIAQRPDGVAQLETLLLETVDIFQHRVDAWATGLAYARLTDRRRAGHKGLSLGYWGILSRLRPTSATGVGDGYIQAPSLAQATTAAVLRSAYRRHRGDGAFTIDLPSRRVRRALAVLDMQRKGLSLSEALGLRGERWLHERKQDELIGSLRELFPLRNLNPPTGATAGQSVNLRIIDGVALAAATSLLNLAAADRAVAMQLQDVLRDDLDAVSDVVMCEAVHQRTLGQSENANAWLQMLSGGPVPGEPVFLRVQRHGQGASHRVALLMHIDAPPASAAPRELAEPTMAAFAEQPLAEFRNVSIPVTVSTKLGHVVVQVAPVEDLGMCPLDLVIGGESELRVRIRQHVSALWLTDAALIEALGGLPNTHLDTFLARDAVITLDLAGGPVPVDVLLAAGAHIRTAVQRGRPLEPSDLNAAASPQAPLTEPAEVTLLSNAAAQLRHRAVALATKMEQDRATFAAAYLLYMTRAREVTRAIDIGAAESVVNQASAQADLARVALVAALVAVSRYAEPEALRPFALGDAVTDAYATEEVFLGLTDRLRAKRDALNTAVAIAAARVPVTRAEARGLVRTLTSALQKALDGEALPILPPIIRVAETTPLLKVPAPAATTLMEWKSVREGVACALQAAQVVGGMVAYAVSEAATEDSDPATADAREQEEAPSSRHFGVFLADPAAIAADSFAGVVSDEWVEHRPSRSQLAALAINYDSPQSEPPHCLLLGVPPTAAQTAWTEQGAALLVWEALQWMKARALSTDDSPAPGGLLPTANQIPFKKIGNRYRRRIPRKQYNLTEQILHARDGLFVRASAEMNLGADGVGLRDATSRYGLQE